MSNHLFYDIYAGKWNSNNDNKIISPQLKGVKQFSFAEVKKYTSNFSQDNDIGSGGYGKVVSHIHLQFPLIEYISG